MNEPASNIGDQAQSSIDGLLTAQAEASIDGILILSQEGSITFFNNRFTDIWHMPQEAMEAKGYKKMLDQILKQLKNPGDYASKFDYLKSNRVEKYVGELELSDGTFLDCYSSPLDNGKEHLGRLWHFHDITKNKRTEEALKENEERLSLIFEYAPDTYYINDLAGTFLAGNKASEGLTGYKREELIGQSFLKLNLIRPDQIPRAAFLVAKSILGQPTGPEEFVLSRKDGSRVDVEVSSYPIKLKGKTMVLGIARDVTERKKREEELKTTSERLEIEKERAEALSSIKDEFIRNITHELKTPLSVILLNLTSIKDMAPENNAEQYMYLVEMLSRNAARLRDSIEQILELSKLGTVELKKEEVHLKDILDDVGKEHLPLAQIKGIGLILDSEQIVFSGDKQLIKLAINNLVSNAIKFTSKGSVQVKCKSFDGGISISVSDTGLGISQENQKKLFEKFFKANPSAPGTGIGLHIAKQIVDKFNGKINVKSKLGYGTTFEIIIPSEVRK